MTIRFVLRLRKGCLAERHRARNDRAMEERRSDAAKALSAALSSSLVRLDTGLSEFELKSVEDRFGFAFAPDHRLMLSLALPLDDDGRWPDWRREPEQALRKRLQWPVKGLLFDVQHNDLWLAAWGERPSALAEALASAALALEAAPVLAPLCSHRYVPTMPPEAGNPVLSCYQSDIICYGRDLLDWFAREFHGDRSPITEPSRHVPFWSEFLE